MSRARWLGSADDDYILALMILAIFAAFILVACGSIAWAVLR